MKDYGKVGVIMPVYNAKKTVIMAIKSIVRQKYENWMLIVVDDGSTDGSFEIMNEYFEKNKTEAVIHREAENQGTAHALAVCQRLAQSYNCDYFARMDADDRCSPKRLHLQLRHMEENDLDICGTFIKQVCLNKKGKISAEHSLDYPIDIRERNLMKKCPIAHGTAIMKEMVLNVVGTYRFTMFPYNICEDYDYWLMAYRHGFKLGNLPMYLYTKYEHKDSNVAKVNRNLLNGSKMLAKGMYLLDKGLRQ
jgi:glycosyltransferase involved in cell wall biosynthesis